MIIVALSDTHRMHRQIQHVPDGDVLVHTGDFCGRGSLAEFKDFVDWFAAQPHQHKVFTCGNHDWVCEKNIEACRDYVPAGVEFLVNESTVIDGKVFYGSPVTPQFFNWAFMEDRGEDIRKVWAQIPDYTDVLLTHALRTRRLRTGISLPHRQ